MIQQRIPGAGVFRRDNDGYQFRVWSPAAKSVELHVLSPQDRLIPMQRVENGYYQATVQDVGPGTRYRYRLDNDRERPDPASRYQPEGVHGPSEIITEGFTWTDERWKGLPLHDYIIYELHIGTFTSEGTFDAAIPYLDDLKDLGITAIEIMPVAQFPGERNWGYDGVDLFAVQNSYGGPEAFKRLIDACHQRGVAVILDVVYNHLGAEGNYLWDFGPYFTDRYKTPWGAAVNFDGPNSDQVRAFFIDNACYWISEFHVDALRLDATHAYMDVSAQPFLQELTEAVHDLGTALHRNTIVIAENDRSDWRIVSPVEVGGYGVDGQWCDDMHHALHTLLTGESVGYYQDFAEFQHLVRAVRSGFAYSGHYSSFHQRRHGSNNQHIPSSQLIVCAQNHDQIGNRMLGERLSQLVSFEAQKLAAGLVLLSPYIPLLFMGEEFGETAPFLYFIDHSDADLVEAVRKGRREEFADFHGEGEPPDPKAASTFEQSKLDYDCRRKGHHRVLFRFYKRLIELRKSDPVLSTLTKHNMEVVGFEKPQILYVHRWLNNNEVFVAYNFNPMKVSVCLPVPAGRWRKRINSADEIWRAGGHPGAFGADPAPLIMSDGELTLELNPTSFALYTCEK